MPRRINYEVDTLAVVEWVVTFGTARRGLGGAAAVLPINGQCINHRIAV